MNIISWGLSILTVSIIASYEIALGVIEWRNPDRLARSNHVQLRQVWFDAITEQQGSEILAVQTLRNSLMSATMTASTAALGLMGTITLAAQSLHSTLASQGSLDNMIDPRTFLELVLLSLLFISLSSSVMAVRYYNHVSFIAGIPSSTSSKRHWIAIGRRYIARAGRLYSLGLRHLVLVAPIVAALLHPIAGPMVAILAAIVLFNFDKVQPELSSLDDSNISKHT